MTFQLFKSKGSASGVAPTKRVKKRLSENNKAVEASHGIDTFASLGLSPWLQQSCAVMGLHSPTPIQCACIPETLKMNTNVLGQAQTGSGKTAAFALPILETLSREPYGVFAVVLTPARELAYQIGEQFLALGSPIRVRCEIAVGGVDMLKQAIAIKQRPHVLVGTPGRIAAHITGPDPPFLKAAKFLVLDEADRLLSGTYC